jgi:hypothetical protein
LIPKGKLPLKKKKKKKKKEKEKFDYIQKVEYLQINRQ